jgi:hypothetical protein
MTERAGWKAPVWTYEQASSHRMHPVHRSGVIRNTFMDNPHTSRDRSRVVTDIVAGRHATAGPN